MQLGIGCFAALKHIIKLIFQAAQTLVIGTDKAENLRCRTLFSIIALAFLQKMQALQIIILNNFLNLCCFLWLHRALQPDKASAAGKNTVKLLGIRFQHRCQQIRA